MGEPNTINQSVPISSIPLPPDATPEQYSSMDRNGDRVIDFQTEYLLAEQGRLFANQPALLGAIRTAFFGNDFAGYTFRTANPGRTTEMIFENRETLEVKKVRIGSDNRWTETTTSPNSILTEPETRRKMIRYLRTLVETTSYSENPEGVSHVIDTLDPAFQALRFTTQTIRPEDYPAEFVCDEQGRAEPKKRTVGNHFLAKRKGREGAIPILLVGHTDTVYPLKRVEEGGFIRMEPQGTDNPGIPRYVGPGIADMKGGIVVILFTLYTLDQLGFLDDFDVTVFLGSDEEIGSLDSRKHIERLAAGQAGCFVFERNAGDSMAIERQGIGHIRLLFEGKSAPSSKPGEGASAILERNFTELAVDALNREYQKRAQRDKSYRGILFNIGRSRGGTGANTVPSCADTLIEVRYENRSQEALIRKDLAEIVAKVDVHTAEGKPVVTKPDIQFHRPPKRDTPETATAFERARGLFALYARESTRITGRPFVEKPEAGAADGSITQAVGCPTLDSVGVEGGSVHTPGQRIEFMDTASLFNRTEIMVHTLARIREERR
ncbi:MAG: M20/M25/M40 family metallo-hydrolase [Deltaproteobacteria bacterium]|nr:M20/M25/M40 family metallo-hydrolase [Deltaproteobacteria bacterium]